VYSNLRDFLLYLLFIAIGACQPLPQPFQTTETKKLENPLLKIPDSGGGSVIRLSGIEKGQGDRLSLEIVRALQKRNFLSTSGAGNKRSITVEGMLTVFDEQNQDIRVQILWEIFSSRGISLGDHTTSLLVDKVGWEVGKNETIRRVADHAATNVILLLRPSTPTPKTKKNTKRSIYIWPIYGAPSDATALLQEQLIFFLKQRSIPVVFELQEKAFVLTGEISLHPSSKDKQSLVIQWTLLRPDGGEIGNLHQENEVTNRNLELDWPNLAKTIADTAAQGIVEILSNGPSG
tara:strand:+ start:824 stop:1696 length:873 start_codon:yes stop_codon:yes gene_type:complete